VTEIFTDAKMQLGTSPPNATRGVWLYKDWLCKTL